MLNPTTVRDLAATEPGQPVLSLYVRTDPRDPANAVPPFSWEIEVKNALRTAGEGIDATGSRDDHIAFEALRAAVERDLTALSPERRGRSVAWFLGADGTEIARFDGLRIPVAKTLAVWDDRPFVSPLVDVADRGQPVGLLLVDGETVRVLETSHGVLSQREDSTFELELGDWRQYGGSAAGSPARGQMTTSHQEHYKARVSEQRHKLFESAATATAARAAELGWHRVIVIGEGQYLEHFVEALPEPFRQSVIATIDHNVAREDLPGIAALVDPVIERVWREQLTTTVAEARDQAGAGGVALGADETLSLLIEGRVAHLIVDPDHDFSDARAAFERVDFDGTPDLLAERAIEAAVAAGGRVSTLPEQECDELRDAGGMLALLRY